MTKEELIKTISELESFPMEERAKLIKKLQKMTEEQIKEQIK